MDAWEVAVKSRKQRMRESLEPPPIKEIVSPHAYDVLNWNDPHFQVLFDKKYHARLAQDGGRPSHPLEEIRPGMIDGPNPLYAQIIRYWASDSCYDLMGRQWTFWDQFRRYQDGVRAEIQDTQEFEDHVRYVRYYRRSKGLVGDTSLQYDRKQQNQLEDWIEFQFRAHEQGDELRDEVEGRLREKGEGRRIIGTKHSKPRSRQAWVDERLAIAAGGEAELAKIDKHSALLEWIDGQLMEIATESFPEYLESMQKQAEGRKKAKKFVRFKSPTPTSPTFKRSLSTGKVRKARYRGNWEDADVSPQLGSRRDRLTGKRVSARLRAPNSATRGV